MSYDDLETLDEFATAQGIPYPLLSDIDSKVIRQYGILNTQISEDDAFIHGIPYPGVFICDEQGIVTAKFFHDSYKKRDSPENLIDAAMGRIHIDQGAARVTGGEADINITATVRGGRGSLRQGIIRHLVLRFQLAPGLHIYGEPVPKGLTATRVTITGPADVRTLPARFPPSAPLRLPTLDMELQVWSGEVEIVLPFYAAGDLATEAHAPTSPHCQLEFEVAYQACTELECLLPRRERFTLELPVDVVDVPNLGVHRGHGQREGQYDSTPAMRRLLWRKVRARPLGLVKLIWKTFTLKVGNALRRRESG